MLLIRCFLLEFLEVSFNLRIELLQIYGFLRRLLLELSLESVKGIPEDSLLDWVGILDYPDVVGRTRVVAEKLMLWNHGGRGVSVTLHGLPGGQQCLLLLILVIHEILKVLTHLQPVLPSLSLHRIRALERKVHARLLLTQSVLQVPLLLIIFFDLLIRLNKIFLPQNLGKLFFIGFKLVHVRESLQKLQFLLNFHFFLLGLVDLLVSHLLKVLLQQPVA